MEDFPPIPNINTSTNTFFHDTEPVRKKSKKNKAKLTPQAARTDGRSRTVRRKQVPNETE